MDIFKMNIVTIVQTYTQLGRSLMNFKENFILPSNPGFLLLFLEYVHIIPYKVFVQIDLDVSYQLFCFGDTGSPYYKTSKSCQNMQKWYVICRFLQGLCRRNIMEYILCLHIIYINIIRINVKKIRFQR